MTPNISVLIYTARDDYPYVDRPRQHCFEPVLETLKTQTFRYFDLVIVDALWEKRRDYFRGYSTFFPIRHVPASPNIWHERGRPGLCAQLNRGLAWCDGELVWIGAENNLYPPHFLQTAWNVHRWGKVPVAWYAILGRPRRSHWPEPVRNWRYPPVRFDMLGYTEDLISDVDHRAERFADPSSPYLSECHHQHHFAYSGLPLELAYELNGFDESLDGDLSALDVDMGSRIEMLRGEHALAMHRDLWLMEPPTVAHWSRGITRLEPIKCGYAIWWWNRLERRTRVNTPQRSSWIEEVKQRVCEDACPIRERCEAGDPGVGERYLFPFCENFDQDSKRFWLENLPAKNLRADAEIRRRGEFPFDRFTGPQ